MIPHATWRLLGLVGCIAVLMGVFAFLVQPWFAGWGATDDELRRPLPGDEIIPAAASQETRAITIHAPVAAVWPWLAQIGRDRGGFYSYDLLENIVGCEMPTVDRLRPDRQSWKIGDKLWMYPENKASGAGFATLRTFIPGRVLGFGTHTFGTMPADPENGSWTFVLEPTGDDTTRLLIRGRMAEGRPFAWRVFDRLVFEPMHFAMERRMMIGLKQLAEGSSRERASDHIQSGLWVLAFGLAITAVCLVFRRSRWSRALVAFVAAASVFEVLTLGQPSIWVGIALLLFVATWLPWKRETRSHPAGAGAGEGLN